MQSSSESLIGLTAVSKTFHARRRQPPITALDGISLDIGENEFVSVVGRSGCGKSTLLRLIAGLAPVSDGKVFLRGEQVRQPSPEVSLVFQRPSLLPWRTVIGNVLLPVEILRLNVAQYRDHAMELLELVGLAGFEERHPGELSGGMQQRAALCRALIHDPAVLLMDEPFGALDALTRDELGMELQRIWSERRKTIIFVTHSISEAVLLADRVVVFTPRPGRVADIIDVDAPRPRDFTQAGMTESLKRSSDRVRELLFAREEEPETTGAVARKA